MAADDGQGAGNETNTGNSEPKIEVVSHSGRDSTKTQLIFTKETPVKFRLQYAVVANGEPAPKVDSDSWKDIIFKDLKGSTGDISINAPSDDVYYRLETDGGWSDLHLALEAVEVRKDAPSKDPGTPNYVKIDTKAGSNSNTTQLTFTWKSTETIEYAVVKDGAIPNQTDWKDAAKGKPTQPISDISSTHDVYIRTKADNGYLASESIKVLDNLNVKDTFHLSPFVGLGFAAVILIVFIKLKKLRRPAPQGTKLPSKENLALLELLESYVDLDKSTLKKR